MRNLVAAELLKVRGTRSMTAVAALAVVSCVAWAVVDVLAFDVQGGPENAYSMAQQGYLFALILGILVTAGEYRHRTVAWVLLVTPRRGRVITAKLGACAVLGVLVGAAAVAVTAPVTAVLLAITDRPMWTPGVPAVLAGCVLSTTLWCVFGAALGLLVRNQTAAIVTAFVWFFYAEWFLVMLAPGLGRWTPTGASKAVAGWDRAGLPVAGELLPSWAGGLVFLAYTLAAAGASRLVTIRRDVT